MESIGQILKSPKFAELRERADRHFHDQQIANFERVSQGLPLLPHRRLDDPYALPGCPRCGGTGTVREERGQHLHSITHPDTQETIERLIPQVYEFSCRCLTRDRMAPKTAEECGLVGRLETLTLDGVEAWRVAPDVWGAVQRWAAGLPETVKGGEMDGLLLSGPVGTGKTGLMAGVLHAARVVGVRCQFVREVDIVKQIRATYDGEGSETAVIERFEKVPLLAIDDLGKAYVPPKQYGQDGLQWLGSILYAIIDERLTAGRPTLVSTNLDDAALLRRMGDALMDRLDTFWRLDFAGSSRR